MAISDQILTRQRARWDRVADAALENTRLDTVLKTPVRTGYLAEGTRVERRDESPTMLGGVIRNIRMIASWVDKGTQGGQIIRPVRAKVLRFVVGGSTVFARRVVRGATPARNFFEEPMPARWSEAVRRALAADRG